jgi:hypothetical protein
MKRNTLFIVSWAFRLFIDFIGYVGLLLIVYELVAYISSSRWVLIDRLANSISITLTLFSAMVTAGSVYFYNEKPNPPEKVSVYFAAPLIILMCFIAMFVYIRTRALPANVVNGFALMAIAGALYRLHINPVNDRRAFWKPIEKANGKIYDKYLGE